MPTSLSVLKKLWVCVCLLGALSVFAAEELPPELQGLGVTENLGKNIDLNLEFQDETGATVSLKKYFSDDKPVIVSLIYYSCPSLCNLILNAQLDVLKKIDWTVGQKFRMVNISIDPTETPEMAAKKKVAYLTEYNRPGAEADWHFLVGKKANIDAVASQIGFKFKWVEDTKQYAHGSVFFVLTGAGKISRYIYGLMFEPKDLRFALLEASQGHIGSFMDRILLFCYHYDATQKKYVVMANRVMTFGAGATFLALVSFLGLMWQRERRRTI